MVGNAKIEKFICNIMINFQTMCKRLQLASLALPTYDSNPHSFSMVSLYGISLFPVFCEQTVMDGNDTSPVKSTCVWVPCGESVYFTMHSKVCQTTNAIHSIRIPIVKELFRPSIMDYFADSSLNQVITQCLKITEKVSFNIASEASYVYILSWTKVNKECQK